MWKEITATMETEIRQFIDIVVSSAALMKNSIDHEEMGLEIVRQRMSQRAGKFFIFDNGDGNLLTIAFIFMPSSQIYVAKYHGFLPGDIPLSVPKIRELFVNKVIKEIVFQDMDDVDETILTYYDEPILDQWGMEKKQRDLKYTESSWDTVAIKEAISSITDRRINRET